MVNSRRILLVIAVLALAWRCSSGDGAHRTPLPDSAGDTSGDTHSGADTDASDVRDGTAFDTGDASDAISDGEWEELAPIGAGAQQETAVLAVGGKIYVIGGFDASTTLLDRVSVYDPQTNSWSQAAPVPAPLHHANAAVVDGKIYVVGFLTDGFSADGRVFIYAPQSDSWTDGQPMPSGRERGASATAAIDGQIYVVGGLRGGAVAEVSAYDPEDDSWTTLSDAPRSVDHAAFGVIDGRLILAGGRVSRIGAHTDRVDTYDPQADQWASAEPMPTSRGGTASAVSNGKLYVFGGEGELDEPSGVFDEVEAYDPQSDSWEILPIMPNPRHGMGAATLEGRIFVPGGADRRGFAAVDTHSVFGP